MYRISFESGVASNCRDIIIKSLPYSIPFSLLPISIRVTRIVHIWDKYKDHYYESRTSKPITIQRIESLRVGRAIMKHPIHEAVEEQKKAMVIDRENRELQKTIGHVIKWEWQENDGGWISYDDAISIVVDELRIAESHQ